MASNPEDKKKKKLRNNIIIYSLILIIASLLFWVYCKFCNKANLPFPPITTIAVWVSFGSITYLFFVEEKIIKIFGKEGNEIRKNIFNLIGVIFMSFILALTLLWTISPLTTIPYVLYFQSFILMGLFIYYVMFLYYVLNYFISENNLA